MPSSRTGESGKVHPLQNNQERVMLHKICKLVRQRGDRNRMPVSPRFYVDLLTIYYDYMTQKFHTLKLCIVLGNTKCKIVAVTAIF